MHWCSFKACVCAVVFLLTLVSKIANANKGLDATSSTQAEPSCSQKESSHNLEPAVVVDDKISLLQTSSSVKDRHSSSASCGTTAKECCCCVIDFTSNGKGAMNQCKNVFANRDDVAKADAPRLNGGKCYFKVKAHAYKSCRVSCWKMQTGLNIAHSGEVADLQQCQQGGTIVGFDNSYTASGEVQAEIKHQMGQHAIDRMDRVTGQVKPEWASTQKDVTDQIKARTH